ncbi:MAG: hypothetical protein H7Y31_02210 [Chitinophagaceae bacterium]|nr:hypothetical protein [Chitinophagaceae bacterium]
MKSLLYILLMYIPMSSNQNGKGGIVRGYAYVTESFRGAQIKVTDENGRDKVEPTQMHKSYQFYVELRKGVTIEPQIIWIDGIAYKASFQTVDKVPVLNRTETIGNNSNVDTLVAKTTNAVLHLWQDGLAQTTNKPELKKIGLDYLCEGKKYRFLFKDAINLAPRILQ